MSELPIEDMEALLAHTLELEDNLTKCGKALTNCVQGSDLILNQAAILEVEKRDLAHWTRRMLQALDIYWLHSGGLSHARWLTVRSTSTDEDWWIRYERYRARVESLL
jgi:hypothetical protein